MLVTGDVVYPDGGYDSYGRNFCAPYRDLIKTTLIFPVLGTHDVMTEDGKPYWAPEPGFLPVSTRFSLRS